MSKTDSIPHCVIINGSFTLSVLRLEIQWTKFNRFLSQGDKK